MKNKSESYWRKKLTPEQYKVLREKATEQPFTGHLLNNKDTGLYACTACGAALFASGTKFASGSGWPSFYDVATKGAVELVDDSSHGMNRTEVVCTNCGSHLGHLFNDAFDQPTGQRYCINSCALDFKPEPAHPVRLQKTRSVCGSIEASTPCSIVNQGPEVKWSLTG